MFSILRLLPEWLITLDPQPSQQTQLGLPSAISEEEAHDLASHPEAWACFRHKRMIGCVGIRETFPGVQGVAWAFLASEIGDAHLAMTRFARARIMGSPLKRIEAIAKCADAEGLIAAEPGFDAAPWYLTHKLARSTPDCIWAGLVGLRPVHVLRHYGAASETHMLFERIGGHG